MPPDPKPPKRVKDPDAMKRYRLLRTGDPCDVCELRPGIHVHHKIFRSQGGDDVESNWLWLCLPCHSEAHGIRSFDSSL